MNKIIIASIFITSTGSSAIYQCQVDGKKTFQQHPCNDHKKVSKCDTSYEFCQKNIRNLKKEKIVKAEKEAERKRVEERRQRRLNPPKTQAQIDYEKHLKKKPFRKIAKAIVNDLFYVEYFASGSEMSATYTNQSGSTEQNTIGKYWYKSILLPKKEHVYLSVQNKSKYGEVKIVIRVNGTVYKEANTDSPFGIAKGSLRLSNAHIGVKR